MKKHVLVTGGAGFIGSHLVDALMERGFRVRVVDNLSSGTAENVKRWMDEPGFEFVQGDLKDAGVALRSVEDVELVFHLAANPDVRVGGYDPSVHFNENLVVTFNVLEAMRMSKEAKRIIFASSSTVYGEPKRYPTPENYGPLLPISIYGASKLGCEALVTSYCHMFNFSGAILRFANIVGSRATHGVIIDFVNKLRRNPSELEILGDGNQKKSYLHVKDIVNAFFVVLNNLDRNQLVQVFNVGSSDQINVKRIAEIVHQEMGISKPHFRFNNALKDGRGWKGDVKKMRLSTTRLMSLGWKPSSGSGDAVRQGCMELLQS
jgi:UDP-glucose 4-epimerase